MYGECATLNCVSVCFVLQWNQLSEPDPQLSGLHKHTILVVNIIIIKFYKMAE